MNKIIINTCLTGMVPTRDMTPHIPISPKEIAQDALKVAKLGASIVHIHPRNLDGTPTWKKEVFKEIISRIKEKNDRLLISVTTSGRLWNDFERRSEVLELSGDVKPDLASLTLGSMNFINIESINSPKMIEDLANKMKDNGIKPEMEIFEPGMIHKAKYLIEKAIISNKAPYFIVFFGSLGTAPLEPSMISAMHALLPDNAIWSMAGIGKYQIDANILGLSLGANIRVGLEDNIYFDREKKILATNESLVKRIVKIAKMLEINIAAPKETAEILKI